MTYSSTILTSTCDMLSGKPLLRPMAQVFGPNAMDKAKWAVAIAERDIKGADRNYAAACAELGKANACGKVYGRVHQRPAAKAAAFRMINRARAARRAACKALTAAQAAVAALAG